MKIHPHGVPTALIALLATCLVSAATATADSAAPGPDIDATGITVSGISSGAAMAQQLHLAHPELFSGAALIAGVPRGCADGQLATAMAGCMGKAGENLDAGELAERLRTEASAGRVGDPALLADDRAWTFHGQLDATVAEDVSLAATDLYRAFMATDNVAWVDNVAANHTFPTHSKGGACDAIAPPFLGACDYDAAGELLTFLYPGLTPPEQAQNGELVTTELPGAAAAGLADEAWLYVPESCPATGCRLHLVLHGCGQSQSQVDMAFMEGAGYLEWAQDNAIVLAFPQVAPAAANPLACWDWWGYTGPDYMTREGAQIRVLADWIRGMADS
ncbi:hypothetical protein F3N42_06015 [Marinihelvus fidelis]|uniref:Poly(3-hydroxybutyrate) depolymerase n=1 Tax=Marinihelvus fidelis TaxID=2613842 RepID=A0A5N0TCN6_9GAMM|nr:PHB depolymerase family esterase [Marinihelvus fidelis]KAA9132765.1 hypothetical protein F3N42_06015 [Marinihelvus fidelis]